MRDQYRLELYRSLAIGNIITLVIFAFTHKIFDGPLEVMAFWIGMCLVATYAAWTLMIVNQKRRDA